MSDATHESHTTERRIPVKRFIVLALIILGGYAAFGPIGVLKPISPVVVLPGEPIWPGSPITNTLLATFVTDALLLLMAAGAWLFVRSGKMVPEGFYNFTEFLIEFLWNAAESTAGKWAKRIFPVTATIFLLVFVANLVKLVPGFESIGYLKERHEGTGYSAVQLGGLPVYGLDKDQPHDVVHHEEGGEDAHGGEAVSHDPHAEEDGHGDVIAAPCVACEVVPFLRGSATDLNFTFALAVVAVVATQVVGFWALGPGYLTKFFNTKTMFTVPMFGVIDFGVGLLELVSEFAKILSFGFRLFGNIFAGALLLSILGALTAIIVPTGLYLLEVFVGAIQAYVFSMLTLVFMSQATVSHHGDDHH